MSTDSNNTTWVLYQYTPNKAAAIALTVLFLLATGAYVVEVALTANKASKKLKSYLNEATEEKSSTTENLDAPKLKISMTVLAFIPFLIGCLMEAVGYIGRALSASDPQATGPYIIQSVLLLVAPALYAATIYMIFGRMLRALKCQSLILVSARFGTSFFVLGDVISFFLQAAGGGAMAKNSGNRTTGTNLIIAGLAVQVVFFGFFILNELRFTICVKGVCPFYDTISKKWWFLNLGLLSSSILIMIRSIIRIVEFAQGSDGYIMSHEYFIYVFDAALMLLVIIVFAVGGIFGNIFDVIVESQTISPSNYNIFADSIVHVGK